MKSGLRILVCDPPSAEQLKEREAEFVPLRDLLARSDVVTIHIPYTPETHHMISEKELALMRKDACIINTSKGSVVDAKALLSALRSGKLRGAALDVLRLSLRLTGLWRGCRMSCVLLTSVLRLRRHKEWRLCSWLRSLLMPFRS